MNRVFEDVVGAGLRQALEPHGGRVAFQDTRNLDRMGYATIRPDVVWTIDGRPMAIIDAKYKLPTTKDIDNADIYQVLVYAARYGLTDVHLVYAEQPPVSQLEVGDVTVHLHHLELGLIPSERAQSFGSIGGEIRRCAEIVGESARSRRATA
jgi:5-methylcytosine-specific restriction enzyme subunit McrC